MSYVNGVGVHSIMAIDRAGLWENVTHKTSSRLPSFRNTSNGRTVRVEVSARGSPTFKAFHHGQGPSSLSDPLFTAETDKRAAESLREYFENGFSGVSL